MARPPPPSIALRLTIADPLPGVRYSLCDDKNQPVAAATAGDAPLSFNVPVTVRDGRPTGPFVRREGSERRFVYISLGGLAGDAASSLNGRVKVDVHDIPPALIDQALKGKILAVDLPGRNGKGGPALATVHPLGPWRVAD